MSCQEADAWRNAERAGVLSCHGMPPAVSFAAQYRSCVSITHARELTSIAQVDLDGDGIVTFNDWVDLVKECRMVRYRLRQGAFHLII